MKDETKLAKLAAMFNLQEHLPPTSKPPDPQESERTVQASREAEAVIHYLDDPKKFKTRKCGTCDLTFAVDRANISRCSDTCRRKHLLETFGVDVDFTRRTPEDRWRQNTGGREPLIVPPAVITLLQSRVDQSSALA